MTGVLVSALVVVVSAFVLVAAVATLVSSHKQAAPSVDLSTGRRLARSLNRGALPPPGPDRAPGVQLARSRAASHWTVALFLGLAVSQYLLARAVPGIDSRYFYAVAALMLVVSLMTGYQLLASRRALRHADSDGVPRR